MEDKKGKEKENEKVRAFTVELQSKKNLRNLTMNSGSSESVLVEGTIGELVRATFAEGIILEVVGDEGVLRVDLGEGDIQKNEKKKEAAER